MNMQILLTIGLVAIFTIIYFQSLSSRAFKIALLVFIVFGLYLVWQPNQANVISQKFGVGRGADLLLYLWILMSFAGLLLLYLRSKMTDRLLTLLARELAMMNAQHVSKPQDTNKTPSKQ